MNAGQDRALPKMLFGVLIKLVDDALLVPNSALVEVLPGERLRPEHGVPRLGNVEWHGHAVPVVSFEQQNGQATPVNNPNNGRIALLHAMNEHMPAQAWGLWCAGYPHMLPLSAAALEARALHDEDNVDIVLARVQLGKDEVAIPDLGAMERVLLAANVD